MRMILRYLPQILEIISAIEQVQEEQAITLRPSIRGMEFLITVQKLSRSARTSAASG